MSIAPVSPTRRNSPEKLSRVLLICVYDTIVFEITNQLVFEAFSKYGSVCRILIFEKKEVTKLFVEFQTDEEAAQAKEALDGKKLYNNICKMSIYFSTFGNVDLRHQSSQGMEIYSPYVQASSQISDRCSVDSENAKSLSAHLDELDEFSAFGITGVHRLGHLPGEEPFLQRSKTDANQMQLCINRMKKHRNWGDTFLIEESIKSGIDSVLNCESDDKWSSNSQTYESPKKPIKIKNQDCSNDKLTVLCFKTTNQLKNYEVYNLFSNFGNISVITIKRNEVRVKFRTVEFTAIALSYLKNLWFYQNKLQLLSLPSEACWPQQGEYAEIQSYDQSTDRFTDKKSITINPPSSTLHVSGLKRDKCSTADIMAIFKDVAQPARVKILKQGNDKNMALVEFGSLQDSFQAIAACHNLPVGGRKIQISFTKSQI